MVATPWDNGYGLMNPWGNAWGVQPQAVAQNIVRRQVAPAMGLKGEDGDSMGTGAPGDPANAATTSQATKDRVRDSMLGSFAKNLGITGMTTVGNLAAGMPTGMIGQSVMGGLASPGSIGGLVGGALNATFGTTPQGWGAKAIANIGVPGLGFAFGGPVGGLLGGLMGGVVADGLGDAFDARKEEALRDDMEEKSGYFGGRTGYADLQSYAKSINDLEAKAKAQIDQVNSVLGKVGVGPLGYSPTGVSTGRMEVGAPGTVSYGGWGNIGGPTGGARSVDSSYGANMGGFAGLGIGNPSSYGGGSSGGSSGGGVGGLGRGDSTGTGGGFGDGKGGVSGL